MTSLFRFVHTADIHLDSPLKGLAGHEGSAAERIRAATREAFIICSSEHNTLILGLVGVRYSWGHRMRNRTPTGVAEPDNLNP